MVSFFNYSTFALNPQVAGCHPGSQPVHPPLAPPLRRRLAHSGGHSGPHTRRSGSDVRVAHGLFLRQRLCGRSAFLGGPSHRLQCVAARRHLQPQFGPRVPGCRAPSSSSAMAAAGGPAAAGRCAPSSLLLLLLVVGTAQCWDERGECRSHSPFPAAFSQRRTIFARRPLSPSAVVSPFRPPACPACASPTSSRTGELWGGVGSGRSWRGYHSLLFSLDSRNWPIFFLGQPLSPESGWQARPSPARPALLSTV